MVDDLLDMARIARSKVQLRIETCDVVAIVRQTASDYRPVLAARRIGLQIDLPDHPLSMAGDPTRLAQIVGGVWFLAGFAYLAVTTRGFRQAPRMLDFSESP